MLSHKKLANRDENRRPGSGWSNKTLSNDKCNCGKINCGDNLALLEEFSKYLQN